MDRNLNITRKEIQYLTIYYLNSSSTPIQSRRMGIGRRGDCSLKIKMLTIFYFLSSPLLPSPFCPATTACWYFSSPLKLELKYQSFTFTNGGLSLCHVMLTCHVTMACCHVSGQHRWLSHVARCRPFSTAIPGPNALSHCPQCVAYACV